MKRLLDAFLELPTWEGIALIAAFVFCNCAAVWLGSRIGHRIGYREAEDEAVRVRDKRRDLESIA